MIFPSEDSAADAQWANKGSVTGNGLVLCPWVGLSVVLGKLLRSTCWAEIDVGTVTPAV